MLRSSPQGEKPAVPVAVRRAMRRTRVKETPVGIEVGGLGRFGDQRGQGVLDQQPRPDLLLDQLRQP